MSLTKTNGRFSRLQTALPAGSRTRERGQVILMVGLATIVMFGIVGLAVDVGRLYVARVELGRALDAAALSGILELDGTSSGLTAAENKALDYFDDNDPDGSATATACNGDAGSPCNGESNTIIMNASKNVRMIFLSVFGIRNASVSAHAKAGFGTQHIDAAIVIDATGSMGASPCDSEDDNPGCPIWEAKNAAKDFKDILLGTTSTGNVLVGATPFRGCFRATSQSATAPMPNGSSYCISQNSQVTALTSNSTTLETGIDAISAQGGSGTNVCGGLAKGWELLEGSSQLSEPDLRRYMVVLSDGDNFYNGSYVYQSSPYDSPHTYQTYPCRPPLSCSNVGGEAEGTEPWCVSEVYVPSYSVASDDWNGPGSGCPSNWSSGSGWASDWSTGGNVAPTRTTGASPNDTGCHAHFSGTGSLCRAVDLSGLTTATLNYEAKRSSWEGSESFRVKVNTSGCSGGTTEFTHTTSNTGTSYSNAFSVDLDAYVGQTVYITFEGNMDSTSADHFYIDTVDLQSGSSGQSHGYINGKQDDTSGLSCNDSMARERQVDMLTWDLVQAIEADNIEIYVVAFGVCDDSTTVCGADDTCSDAECESLIGNTDHDDYADQRLAKCIASSSDGTNDHYFYTDDASDLPSIFTKIANQIAHRLIE